MLKGCSPAAPSVYRPSHRLPQPTLCALRPWGGENTPNYQQRVRKII